MANHIGLINNSEKSEIVFRLQNKFRSVMYEAFNFKFTGVTRDDIAANNQVARRAISLMGDLDKGFLDGTTRSNNAPYLPLKRLKVASNSQSETTKQGRDDGVKPNAKKNAKPQQKAKQSAKKPAKPRKPEISSNLLDQAIDKLVSDGIKSE